MATTYRIHPAMGIARVGNSPDEYFVGPERPWELPDPPGGFKDDRCRVKRQAARFRIFAHHDDGTTTEVTAADADITWTVHLANAKAGFPGRGNAPSANLTIDPGARSLSTPNGRELVETGTISFAGQPTVTVPLGEIRTDDDGHLLVLGGAGSSASPAGNGITSFWASPGWYDDVSDGPVTASLTLHGGGTHAAEGAWVLVGPPKFAPHQDSVTTLYDRVLQQMVDDGLVAPPAATSYTDDVYPILQRARDMAWVEGTLPHHAWAHPITDQAAVAAIVARVTDPAGGGGNMPPLNDSGTGDRRLTPTQYEHLRRWRDGQYAQDWAGVPTVPDTVTPDGMDRAALDAATGGAFFPGIEAGGLSPGQRPVLEKPYAAPFRLDHAHAGAGDITASLALPWQADFQACGDRWWPVPRPNTVLSAPGGPTVRWARDVLDMDEMVSEWNSLGFVVKQGSEHIESQHCDERSILLLTPHLDFLDVGVGPMGMTREVPLAITFEVVSPGAAVTLEYAPGGAPNHPRLVPIGSSVMVGPTDTNAVATARLWVVYRTGTVGATMPTQAVVVREPVSGRTWQVTIDGNTVDRATTSVAMALDRSGSMADDRGDGQPKHTSLRQAANLFVDLMLEGDGAGIVRFDHDAQVLLPVRALGNGQITDTERNDTHDVIDGNALDPGGATSIGDGIFEARGIADAASGFDRKALVVLTDGIENSPRWIRDVSAQLDATTYAIGFGRPENISVPALQTISGNHGGYLLVTGPVTGDDRFRLQKHFLQVLAGINGAEVVLDPEGTIGRGDVVSVPFSVTDADAGIEVVLLTPNADVVDFRLQTPTGQLVEPWLAHGDPGMQFGLSDGAAWFRLSLPTQLLPGRFDQAGRWHALLTLGRPRVGPDVTAPDPTIVLSPASRGADRDPIDVTVDERELAELSDAQRRFATSRANVAAHHHPGHGRRLRLPYSLVVNSYSSLSFRARADQREYAPSARVEVSAHLAQAGIGIDAATVWADVTTPTGSSLRVGLTRDEPTGTAWRASLVAAEAGVYHGRVRARGRTRLGAPFTREQVVTAVAWHGAGRPDDPATAPPGDGGDGACDLVRCLLGEAIDDRGRERFAEWGIDLDRVLACVSGHLCGGERRGDDGR